MKSNTKIYWIFSLLILGSYAWILFQAHDHTHQDNLTLCLFKNVTGIPCPACGTTRALLTLMDGEIAQAIMLNPFGIIAAIALIIFPFWIVFDLITRSNSLITAYSKVEEKIKTQKFIYLPLIALALLNWYWNIVKEI